MENWPAVVILGVIEGITEFLPVSSTGHLLLAEALLPRQSDLFNVLIQSGAVLAVALVFGRRLGELWRSRQTAATRAYVGQLGLAFGITGVGGLAIKRAGLKLPEEVTPVAWATLVGGIGFVALETALARRQGRAPEGAPGGGAVAGRPFSWPLAAGMGAAQLVAAIYPGTSRSGATILLALACGVARPQAAEFSFLLGIPTLLAAGGLQLVHALKDAGLGGEGPMLLLGSAVAAACAFASVTWLLGFVRRHSFVYFGWYRIVLGGALLLWGR